MFSLANYPKIVGKATAQGAGSMTFTLDTNGVYEFVGAHESGGIADYLITTYNSKMLIIDKSTSSFISHSYSGLVLTITNQYTISYSLVKYN